MTQIGRYNNLIINRTIDFGAYLDGENLGEILIPQKYLTENNRIGDEIKVFVYLDSEDRLIATTEIPKAQVGEFAFLKVNSVNKTGAFLDWGLTKELLVPFREQKVTMTEGRSYMVFVYVDDETQRIVASAKIDKFLNNTIPEYQPNEEVDLIIECETDIGYNAIINHQHSGILYHNELYEALEKGQKIKGYIKKIRPDEKIDLTLYKPGYQKISSMSDMVMYILRQNDGYMSVNDKTDAETIYDLFGMSKKNFKKCIGALYKKKIISIEKNGIRIN